MSRSFAVSALAAFLLIAPAADAAPVGCAGLQDALNTAAMGDTVVLSAAGGLCQGQFFLPENDITLEGEDGAGFQPEDDTGTGRSVSGDSHGQTTVLRNLVFRGPLDKAIDNGGLIFTGNGGSLTLDRVSFYDIRNSGSGGGAYIRMSGPSDVTVTGSTFATNDAGQSGGGLRLDATFATVTGSVFDGNEAGQHGGGLALTTAAIADQDRAGPPPDGDALLTDNSFTGNVAGAAYDTAGPAFARSVPPANNDGSAHGGGLLVGKTGDQIDGVPAKQQKINEAGGARPQVRFARNLVEGNTVEDHDRFTRSGGGIAAFGVTATFDSDRIKNNDVDGDAQAGRDAGPGGGEGGGISVDSTFRGSTVLMTNVAVAGNSVGQGGFGAGIYTGGCNNCKTTLFLLHTTVAGNVAGIGSSGAGIGGDFNDELTVQNSIVFGNPVAENSEALDVSGFNTVAAGYSDICFPPPVTAARADANGNICEDPLLVAPSPDGGGDVHLTAASPAIDAAALYGEIEPAVDYEGDARPELVSNRSETPYDMGADEFVSSDYGVTLTATPDPVLSGDQLTLKAVVTNNGPSTARSLSAVFDLGGAALVSASSTKGECTGTVTCNLGDLLSGQSATITIVVTAPTVSGRASKTVTATVTVSSKTPDPSAANNTASKTVTVNSKATPTPTPTPTPAPTATPTPTPAPAAAVLPSVAVKKCLSRRTFTIRIRKFKRDPVVSASVVINGKKAKVRKTGGRLVATVNLKLKPKITVTVKIKAKTLSGKALSGKRVYHPCQPGREGNGPPPL